MDSLEKDQDRDEDGKRDFDTVSMPPGSGSMPQKENQQERLG